MKWLLIAVAVLLVIGISVGATLLFTRGSGGGGSTPTSGAASDIASASDTGPVSIITDEPTCDAYISISNGVAAAQAKGWSDGRSSLGPLPMWTADQKTQVEAVVTAFKNASSQIAPLIRKTPNRVVRELYEQYVAFNALYVKSVDNYIPFDNYFASASVSVGNALSGICNTIESGATSRSLLVKSPDAPDITAEPSAEATDVQPFVTSANGACTELTSALDEFNSQSSPEWQNRDGGLPGSQWPPERKAVEQRARSQLTSLIDSMNKAADRSDNPPFVDFARTSSLYIQAYVQVGEDYVESDGWLVYTGFRIANAISAACQAMNR